MLGWLVLALVFLDELLAIAAAAVWGGHTAGPWLALVASGVVLAVWGSFASPRAPYGGPVVRSVAKVAVFGLATIGLWTAGHAGWASAFLAFSVVVNALAALPSVRALISQEEWRGPGGRRTG